MESARWYLTGDGPATGDRVGISSSVALSRSGGCLIGLPLRRRPDVGARDRVPGCDPGRRVIDRPFGCPHPLSPRSNRISLPGEFEVGPQRGGGSGANAG